MCDTRIFLKVFIARKESGQNHRLATGLVPKKDVQNYDSRFSVIAQNISYK